MKDKIRHLLGIKSLDGKVHGYDNTGNGSHSVSRSQLKIRVGSIERGLDESSTTTFRSRPHRDVAFNTQGESLVLDARKMSSSLLIYEQASQRNGSGGPRHARQCSQDLLDGSSAGYSEMCSNSTSESCSRGPILTTSPRLYHPMPHRPSALHLLSSQSNDSDDASSTKAQVGMLQPGIPFAEAEQNTSWKGFVFGLDDAALDTPEEPDNLGYQRVREVSPGISHLGLSKQTKDLEDQEEEILLSRFGIHEGGKDVLQNSSPVQPLVNAPDDVQQHTTRSSYATQDTSDGDERELRIVQQRFTGFEESHPNQPTCNSIAQHSSSTEITSSSSQERARLDDVYRERGSLGADCAVQSGTASSSNGLSGVDLLPASTLQGSLSVDTLVNPPTVIQNEAAEHQPINPDLQTVLTQSNQTTGKGFLDDCPSRSEEVSRAQPVSFESENEMWRQFLFGECNDKMEDVLEEARKIAAKKLCPSDQAPSPKEDHADEENQLPLSISQNMLDLDHILDIDQHDTKPQSDLSVADSASHRATFHTSSPSLPSESVPDHLLTVTDTDQATVGSSSSTSEALTAIVDEAPCLSDVWSIVTTRGSDDAPLKAAVPRSNATGDCGDNFRFAKPKLFIGKKASHWGEERQLALSEPQIRGRTLSRRQKRTGDGRTCIRKLPNFTKDPIEDLEEDIQVWEAENSSLFGPLDTED